MLSTLREFFGLAFWQQLFATLVGVVLGIPAALWLSRRQERQDRLAAVCASDARRQQLLTALKREVQFNREQLRVTAQSIEAGKIEAARVSTSLLEATGPLKYEVLPLPVCDDLDILVYLLQAVDGFQRLQLNLLFDPQAHLSVRTGAITHTTFFAERHPRLLDNLKDAVAKATAQIEKVLPQLDSSAQSAAVPATTRRGLPVHAE